MVTESDAVLATIVDNWGGGGYGGATPAIQSTQDISVDRWAALDAVIVLHDTLDERHPPVNDKFVDKEYTMDIRVTSITSEDQLKLLVEETEYLLNNTAITGFTSVRITRKNRGSSDRGRKVYRNDITIEFWARVSGSAVAPSGGTGTGLTGAFIEDLLMWTSANAAWVNCPLTMVSDGDFGMDLLGNIKALQASSPGYLRFDVPLAPLKGSLKLYISGTEIGLLDADAAAYVDATYMKGYAANVASNLDIDGTNKNSAGAHQDTFTAVDCSGQDAVGIVLFCEVDAANELDIYYVTARCYYAE